MRRLLVLAVPSTVLIALSMACTSLTAPPSPDPINMDPGQVTTAAPKPAPSMSAALLPGALSALALGNNAPPPPGGSTAAAPTAPAQPEGKLEIKDVAPGKGKVAKAGDRVSVHYTGKLVDGKEFDSSRPRNKPFDFQLGQGNVIKGWDQGVAGMKVGGKRKLTIPPSLGYGARGMPPTIPPNSTLVFDVELLEVK